ncbi:MAG: hypothetical protein ACRCZU_05370, partial [Selenomonadaceae bacterium]
LQVERICFINSGQHLERNIFRSLSLFHKKFSFLRSLNGCIFLIRQHFSVPDDGIQMNFVKSPFSVAGLFFIQVSLTEIMYGWSRPSFRCMWQE